MNLRKAVATARSPILALTPPCGVLGLNGAYGVQMHNRILCKGVF